MNNVHNGNRGMVTCGSELTVGIPAAKTKLETASSFTGTATSSARRDRASRTGAPYAGYPCRSAAETLEEHSWTWD